MSTVAEALHALSNKSIAVKLKRLHDISYRASCNFQRARDDAEKELKPYMKTIKRYISNRLRREKCYASYQGRGWWIDRKSQSIGCFLHVEAYVGQGVRVSFDLESKNLRELDNRINAILEAVRAMRTQLPNPTPSDQIRKLGIH